MPTITWTIEQNWIKPVDGSKTEVVVTSAYRCKATETVGLGETAKTYIATVDGLCSFAPPSGSFTPYPDLSEEQILGWCYANGVDKTAIEANVTAQIQNQINPPVVVLPLPWVPPVPPVEIVPPLVEQKEPVLVAEPEMIVPPMLPQVEPVLVNTETPVAAVDEQAPVAEAPAA